MNDHKPKYLLADIILGRSELISPKFGRIYVKHLDSIISAKIDKLTEGFEEDAKSKDLPSCAQKLEILNDQKLWTSEDDKKLLEKKSFLSTLMKTKSKLFLKHQVNQIIENIKKTEEEIALEENRKQLLVGLTAESYATKRASQFYIFYSLYKDEKTETPLFDEEDFFDLDHNQMEEFYRIYNEYARSFSAKTLKKIAILPSFMNAFFLCEDDPYKFFGKPICFLTFNQLELFSNGRYYKRILTEKEGQIPHEVQEDPDKLIEWFESGQIAQKIIEKSEAKDGVAISLVGATKEDLERLNIKSDGPTVDLNKELDKNGGRLTLDDMIRLGMV